MKALQIYRTLPDKRGGGKERSQVEVVRDQRHCFVKGQERNFVFRKVSGSAQGVLGDREKLAGEETGKMDCTYTEKRLVCPSGEFASYSSFCEIGSR